MYSSKSRDQGSVQLQSEAQPLDLTLLDDAQRPVLRGYGSLSGSVPVGLYWLEIRSGAELRRQILRVPTEGVSQVVELPIRTAAPLPGSRDDDPVQRAVVQDLSDACSGAMADGEAGLVLFLRGTSTFQPLEAVRPDGASVPLAWTSVPGFSGGWAKVPPGGLWLRSGPDREGRTPTDLALWLTADRVHLWFLPVDDGRPNCAAASWHTHARNASWLVNEEHPEIRIHAEQALAALRTGDSASAEAIVATLKQYKQFDPMLGILAGALLLQRASELKPSDPDAASRAVIEVRGVVDRISSIVPDHPDVLALGHVARALQEPGAPSTDSPLAFPPMLAVLYDAVRTLDLPPGRTLVPGELAARIAGERTSRGPWTAWHALPDAPRADRQSRARVDQYLKLVDTFQMDRGQFITSEAISRATGVSETFAAAALQPLIVESAMSAGPFDLPTVRAVLDAPAVDAATADAFVAWAEQNPQAYQDLARQALAADPLVDKAAPTPIDPEAHVAAVQQRLDDLKVSGPLFAPKTLLGVRKALEDAFQSGRRLRAVGTLRSLSDVALPQVTGDHYVVALSRLDRVEADPVHNEVYVEAGCTIGNLNIALDAQGLALPNMGSGDFQTIAGLLSTGSHGSAYEIGDISSLVLALELATLDPDGKPVLYRFVRPGVVVHHPGYTGTDLPVIARDDPDEFAAAIVSLGCLGIITAVTLRVEPTFFLREDRTMSTWANLKKTFLQAARVPRCYEVLFTPFAGEAEPALVTTRVETTGANLVVRALGLELAARAVGRSTARKRLAAALGDPDRVRNQIRESVTCTQVTDYRRKSFRVLKLGLQIDATASEVAVPISEAMAAANDLRTLVQSRMAKWDHGDPVAFWRDHAVPTSPISMRLAARSTGLLSMQHAPMAELDGEPWCMFEVPILRDPSRDDAPYHAYVEGTDALLGEIEALLRDRYGGRPHWGLKFTATEAQIAGLWGAAWTRWKEVRARLNPHQVFDGRFSDRMGLP